MRIVALMNQNGGVGKTATTVNLGAALAEAGKRVCLIDLDPQAHLTINFGPEPSADLPSLYGRVLAADHSADALTAVATKLKTAASNTGAIDTTLEGQVTATLNDLQTLIDQVGETR